MEVYEVFNLDVPHGNYSACYDIENKYLGITLDETSTIDLEDQFKMCQKANGQFCILNAPLVLCANPPMCLSALYAKDKDSIQKRCSLHIKKASSISIPTSIAPNVWIITTSTKAKYLPESHSCAMGKHPELSYHRHPYIYFGYNQHAVPNHSISAYHLTVNHMKLL